MAVASPPSSARPLLILLTLAAAALSVLAQSLPFGTVNGVPMAPAFALIVLFYWAVYRPEFCPYWIVFLAGLFQDVLSGGPPGLWALIYVIVFEGVYQNRHFFIGRAAYSAWMGFGMAAVLTAVLAWAVGCVYYWRFLSPMPILGQMAITVLCYPLIARVMQGIDRMLGDAEA